MIVTAVSRQHAKQGTTAIGIQRAFPPACRGDNDDSLFPSFLKALEYDISDDLPLCGSSTRFCPHAASAAT